MSLSIGNGFFTTYISSQRMDEIKKDASPPIMSLWEKIKQFFFSTHHDAALKCLHKLYHPAEYSMSSVDIRNTFNELKALASPDCRDKFTLTYYNLSYNPVCKIGSDMFICVPSTIYSKMK